MCAFADDGSQMESEAVSAGETGCISVEVASGRVFRGEVDPKTDDRHLWMRFGAGAVIVQRPIRWESVAQVRFGNLDIPAQEFRDLVDSLRAKIGTKMSEAKTNLLIIGDSTKQNAGVSSSREEYSRQVERVRSLAIEATVANWDADVEVDGLLVCVYPLDVEGHLVELGGTLQVELIGRENVALARGSSFRRLGRWSRKVEANDFGLRGAVYRLPFQGAHPQFDTGYSAHGAVHARLVVPGQGVFEATASDVRVRPPSAFRDDLQQGTGHRYFHGERTGRGQRHGR